MRNNFPCFIPTIVTIIMLSVLTVSSMAVALTHDLMLSSGEETVVSDSSEDDVDYTNLVPIKDIDENEEISEIEPEETVESTETEEVVEIVEDSKDAMDVNVEAPVITTVAVTEEPAAPVVGGLYDIPLDADLQNHIFALCVKRGIDPRIIIGIIYTESRYNAGAIGDSGNSLGLMQIQPRWSGDRMAELGCYDLLNPYENVTVGIDIFADLYESSGSIEWALMAYNGGPGYANRLTSSGIVSDYVYKVLGVAEGFKSY